jgi:iron complex outermembrane recepter protein
MLMKQILVIILLILFIFPAEAQIKKRGRVKRKYRDVERMSESLPQVVFRGLVRDAEKVPVPGASIEIEGLNRRVHANESSQFMLSDLPSGRMRLKITCLGFRTKTLDYMMQAGNNDHYIALDKELIHFEPSVSDIQKREQQIPDIPYSIEVVSGSTAEKLAIYRQNELADFFPGLHYENTGGGFAAFSIRGASGHSGFSGISPSVAVTIDQVPVFQPGGFQTLFFDLEQAEVLKGSQNVLFGRYAADGAVSFSSVKPDADFGGYISAGGGNFEKKEVQAAVNVPVVKDILSVRMAGIWHDRSGFLKNLQGSNLNGDNLMGGRFSLRFTPVFNHKVDVVLNYSKSEEPGTGFLNPWATIDTTGTTTDNRQVMLNTGSISSLEMADATLKYRYYRDEHNYWTFLTSVRENTGFNRRDADGTALPALEMEDATNTRYWFQEVRYNFTRKSRTNGSFGVNYINETSIYSGAVNSDDQLIYEILKMPGNFLMPGNGPVPLHPRLFNPDPLAGIPFAGAHSENYVGERTLKSAQAFIHLTYQVRHRWFITAGARAVYDRMSLKHETTSPIDDGTALGYFTGADLNLFYAPSGLQQLTKNSLSITGQAGIMYRRNENFNLYVNASRGQRPVLLQINNESIPQAVKAENINSLEGGWKTIIGQRVYWQVNGYFRQHENVHVLTPAGTMGQGLITTGGKAISYGAESSLKVALLQGLHLFGSYAWMQSSFDSLTIDNQPFIYAGKNFPLAPEHEFVAGLSADARIHKGFKVFATPWYSWKSHFWFTEANIPGIEQPAYGLLNLTVGVETDNPAITLSVYGTNLLEEKYSSSAGHWGGRLGMPTFIPGSPRMLGARITWKF